MTRVHSTLLACNNVSLKHSYCWWHCTTILPLPRGEDGVGGGAGRPQEGPAGGQSGQTRHDRSGGPLAHQESSEWAPACQSGEDFEQGGAGGPPTAPEATSAAAHVRRAQGAGAAAAPNHAVRARWHLHSAAGQVDGVACGGGTGIFIERGSWAGGGGGGGGSWAAVGVGNGPMDAASGPAATKSAQPPSAVDPQRHRVAPPGQWRRSKRVVEQGTSSGQGHHP